MPRHIRFALTATLIFGLLASIPAGAQEGDDDSTNVLGGSGAGWGVFVGTLQGEEVTNESIFGFRPELDESVTFGGMVYFETTERWLVEFRFGYSSTKILDAVDEDSSGNAFSFDADADLYYIDVSLYPFWKNERFSYGFPFGLGWGWTNTDERLSPELTFRPGLDDFLEDGSGLTYHVGAHGRLHIGERWSLFGDLRYRVFHRLVSLLEENVTTPEINIGFMKSF